MSIVPGATAFTRMPCSPTSTASARVAATSPALRGAVDDAAAKRRVRLDGGDEDDAAPPARPERGDRELGADQGALEVDVDDAVEVLLAHVLEVDVEADGGVRDHDVETAETRDGVVHDPLDVVAPPDVADGGDALRAGVADELERLVQPVGSTSFTTTRAPAAASATAIPRPIPEPAPVTAATLPVSDTGPSRLVSSTAGSSSSASRRCSTARETTPTSRPSSTTGTRSASCSSMKRNASSRGVSASIV